MDFPSPSQPTPSTPNYTGAPAIPPITPPTPAPIPPYTPTAEPVSIPQQPSPTQIPVQSHTSAVTGEDQVYTMPDKFLQANMAAATPPKSKTSRKTLTWVLIIVIILAVLAIVGGVVFYLLRVKSPAAVTPQTAVVNNANANTNTNQVANQNGANANVVANVNTVSNTNINTNTTSNTNVVANTNVTNTNVVPTNTNVPTTNVNANPFTNTNTTTIPSSKDTDIDQLTNVEEQAWSTKADLPDTDSDGYTDGVEVLAGYDPTIAGSARLTVGTIISNYDNKEFKYSIWHPKSWVPQALSQGDTSEVLFTPNSLDTAGQFVEVIVQDNAVGYTALDWYAQQTSLPDNQLKTFTTFAGEKGVWSLDGTTAYFANSNSIYAVTYRYGNGKELYFKSTFELMAKSFIFAKPAQAVTTNPTTNTNAVANTNTNGN